MVVVCLVLAFAGTARAERQFDPSFAPALEKAVAPLASVKAELLEQTLRISAAVRTSTKPRASGLKKKPLSATDFKPAFEGRPVLDGYMLSVAITGEEKKAMREMLESILAQYAKEFRPNNLGTAVAFAVSISVLIADDVDLTAAGDKEVMQTFNDVIANQPGLVKLSAQDKHMISEHLVTMTAIALQFYAVGQSSKNALTTKASVEMSKAILTVLIGQPSVLPAK
jgi:hypothetical protein